MKVKWYVGEKLEGKENVARRELVFIQLIIPLSISLNAIVIMIVPAAAWYLGKAFHYESLLDLLKWRLYDRFFSINGFRICYAEYVPAYS